MNNYNFKEELEFSKEAIRLNPQILDCLQNALPDCFNIQAAEELEDRNGVDFWCHRSAARPLGVDVKVRRKDYAAQGDDDLALETFSDVGRRVPGWTRDTTKSTDFVFWYWLDSGRYALVSFPLLQVAFLRHWEDWVSRYKTCRQTSNDSTWTSECVFVPRREVWRAIWKLSNGEEF